MESTAITGQLILLMAPTGSGKGSLVQYVKEQYPTIHFAVSCTTRAPRPGEIEGVSYYFLSRNDFEKKVAAGDFLEWAEYGGNLYGTLKSEVIERLSAGEVVLNEIELQGIEQLIQLVPVAHRTVIYIEAGGWEVLKARAQARAPISDEELALRYERYLSEVPAKDIADYVVENPDGGLASAKEKLDTILIHILKS